MLAGDLDAASAGLKVATRIHRTSAVTTKNNSAPSATRHREASQQPRNSRRSDKIPSRSKSEVRLARAARATLLTTISFYGPQEFHLMTDKFHFMPDKFHFNAGTHKKICGFGHKVKLAPYWNQQLTMAVRSLNEILVGHNVKFSYRFRS